MKIGCVPYLNARPLVAFLDHPVEYHIPSKLESLLKTNSLDMALLSSISVLNSETLIPFFDGGIISSHGPVESVCLFYKKSIGRIQDIQSVHYTIDSRTSVALFKILWTHYWKKSLNDLQESPNDADAVLLIGDIALYFEDDNYHKVDLGEVWHQMTQLPFVFALWASRHPLDKALAQLFIAAKNKGLKSREDLLPDNQDRVKTLHYLTKNIQYEMNEEALNGLKLFRDYCYSLKLISYKRDLDLI